VKSMFPLESRFESEDLRLFGRSFSGIFNDVGEVILFLEHAFTVRDDDPHLVAVEKKELAVPVEHVRGKEPGKTGGQPVTVIFSFTSPR